MRLRENRHCWIRIILVLGIVKGEKIRYDRHKLYEISLASDMSLRVKREIDRHIALDQKQSEQNLNVTLLVEPHEVPRFESLLASNNISHEELNVNLQDMIDVELKSIKPLNTLAIDFGWKHFYQLETIYAWLDYLAEKYSDLITPLDIGMSFEGRPLKGVRLSYKADNPTVFIEAGIHAKEWIGPATATFILNQLLTSTDTKVKHIARNFNWIVFPVFNPDGYKYTFDVNRLWRKSREPFGSCFGVDLNRNWNASWSATRGSSEEPCGWNYPGPYAFSAPETRKFAEYLRKNVNSQRIETYLSFHSAAKKLLFPFAGRSSRPPNSKDLYQIGEKAIDALAKSNGTQFEMGNAFETMYEAPGTSIDWVYGELNVSIVYAYELRRSERELSNFQDRFLLPADQIEPAGWETLDSIVALLSEAKALGYYKSTCCSCRSRAVIYYSIGFVVLLVVILITSLYFVRKYKLCCKDYKEDRILLFHAKV
ncbi:zinc carboxypeptidase-like [Bradysia coprophila]|uniref:zinc carboxypeptidase-like n=1 Tax=Bradysia coprophila TaxID=38358 RepID=UPI00187DC911|nr:zinc carboxypeptidase-like [Bradysia coprophila]